MQSSNPEISVIVPVYNNENYLKRCIDSILQQTYCAYEIILIDDGSKDGSGRLCDELAAENQCIRVIHQENKGLASSRKVGVDAAVGRYITFVDSDDYIVPEMLQTMYDNMPEFDMVLGHLVVVTDKGEEILYPCSEDHIDFTDNRELIHAFFDRRYLSGSACGMLVKREFYGQIDMCEGAVPGEEICTVLQLYQIVKKIRILSAPLYFYWQNETGISHGGYTERHRKGLDNYIRLCESLVEKYTEIKIEIGAYFGECEMAIMTAMCRNDVYDTEAIQVLQKHLRQHLADLWRNGNTALYYKISALLIIVNYKCFAFLFKHIRKRVGR